MADHEPVQTQTLQPLNTQWVSRARPDERPTREPLRWWDRIKFVLLLLGFYTLFVLRETSDNPLISTREAIREQAEAKWLIWVLLGLELVRQFHIFLTERWPRYHAYWRDQVWDRANTRIDKINPWTRYRLSRVMKWMLFLAVLSIFFAVRWNTTPIDALVRLPGALIDNLLRPITGMPLGIYVLFIGGMMIGQFALLFWFLSKGGIETYFPDDVRTRFSDVWGQDAVLGRVKENILFLENPEMVEERGGHVPGGVLLWGPPGTGKTLMAEAVAGETAKPYVFVEPGAFTNMFMGVGILKVKSLFRRLRKLALKYGGVVSFFDEVDSLGNRGAGVTGLQETAARSIAQGCHGAAYLAPGTVSTLVEHAHDHLGVPDAPAPKPTLVNRVVMGGLGGGGGMGTLESLLAEISGLKKPRGFLNRTVRRMFNMRPKAPYHYRMLLIMATNMPSALDPALLRPGRIDRIYRVGYPTKSGRIKTYEGYFSKVPHEITHEQMEKLATITPYATGASIKDVVNESLIQAIRNGREIITWQDVLIAKNLKALGPSRDQELVPQDRHGVAVHEACHAVAAYRLRNHLQIDLATIDPGQDYLGMVMNIPIEDRMKQFKTEYEADIMVSIASLAGERLFFGGDSASGVSGDLDNATRVATLMEGFWGMGETISSHGMAIQMQSGPAGPQGRDPIKGDILKGGLGDRVEKNLQRLMRHVEDLLSKERTNVLCLAHTLETHKTLSGEDVVAVIERREGPLVDGTVYANSSFVAQIDRYHEQMLAAHNAGQSASEVPFPPAPIIDPEPVLAGAAYEAPTLSSPSGPYLETLETHPDDDRERPAEA